MTEFLIGVVAVLAVLGLFQIFFLRGPDLRAFDGPVGQRHGVDRPPSAEHGALVSSLGGISAALKSVPRRQHLAWLRRYMDTAFPLDDPSVRIIPADAGGVPGEWVLATGPPRKRGDSTMVPTAAASSPTIDRANRAVCQVGPPSSVPRSI